MANMQAQKGEPGKDAKPDEDDVAEEDAKKENLDDLEG